MENLSLKPSIIDIYLKNYYLLISVCDHLTRQSWHYFDKTQTALHSVNFNPGIYDYLISSLEFELLENNENHNQKFFNIVSLKLNAVNEKINEMKFINEIEELTCKNLDFLRTDSGPFIIFILDFLNPSTKEHMNLTLGGFYDLVRIKFEKDKTEIKKLFSLKSLIHIKDNNDRYEQNISQTETSPQKKIKWTGTPSQFGFIIDLLITGGYLKKPSTSFAKDAEYYSTIFDIDTTPGTLAKEVSENTNSLNTENRKKFKIPPKDDLVS